MSLLCIPLFTNALFKDMGAEDPGSANVQVNFALATYFENKPDTSSITNSVSEFNKCVKEPFNELGSSYFDLTASIIVFMIVVSIIFVVIFCLCIYYFIEPTGAVVSVVIYLILLVLFRYFYSGEVERLFDQFNKKIKPCTEALETGFDQYETEQSDAINKALCSPPN